MKEGEAFSSIDLVGQCLIDSKRTELFKKAIKYVVNSQSKVLEVGTGSGILSLFAAAAGSKDIIAIEYDPYVAIIAKKNFKENNFNKNIKILNGDARDISFKKGSFFNVVLMEMLTTGMVDEYQIQAVNNLHNKKVVNSDTTFIPKAQETYISLANTDFNMYGLSIKMVQHLWKGFPGNDRCKIISDKKLLHKIYFNSINNEFVTKIIEFKANKNVVVNSIYLSSITVLTDNFKIGDTLSLNGPVVFPINPFKIKKNQSIKLKISYKFGSGFKNFNIKVIK